MTENEAKQWLKHTRAYQHKCDNCEYIDIKGACNEECKDFYDMAIQALEEIQQYRAIGTVEGYKRAIETSKENYLLYAEYKAKVQGFEAIGTIEEFKALKEKEERFDRNIKMFNEIGLEIRAKTIDEFAERLKAESFSGYVTLEDYCEDTIESVAVEDIVRIAEQMKAGD